MTPETLKALDHRLQKFLEDLTEPMGRSERRHGAGVYVHGLLLDGERKSIEPMAKRLEGADAQALRQFMGQSPWPVEEVERRLARCDRFFFATCRPTLAGSFLRPGFADGQGISREGQLHPCESGEGRVGQPSGGVEWLSVRDYTGSVTEPTGADGALAVDHVLLPAEARARI